eukprot:7833295-Alexandrium_andersonii.AAC.1
MLRAAAAAAAARTLHTLASTRAPARRDPSSGGVVRLARPGVRSVLTSLSLSLSAPAPPLVVLALAR